MGCFERLAQYEHIIESTPIDELKDKIEEYHRRHGRN